MANNAARSINSAARALCIFSTHINPYFCKLLLYTSLESPLYIREVQGPLYIKVCAREGRKAERRLQQICFQCRIGTHYLSPLCRDARFGCVLCPTAGVAPSRGWSPTDGWRWLGWGGGACGILFVHLHLRLGFLRRARSWDDRGGKADFCV